MHLKGKLNCIANLDDCAIIVPPRAASRERYGSCHQDELFKNWPLTRLTDVTCSTK